MARKKAVRGSKGRKSARTPINQIATITATPGPPGSTGFLDLSAELRNEIYEYVLVPSKEILIDKDFQQPALLQVSQQIRAETRKMFFSDKNNTFKVKVYNQDADVLVKFTTRVINPLPTSIEVALAVDTFGCASIANLMKWCRAIWEDKGTDALAPDEDLNSLRRTIVKITQMAETYRGRNWEEFKNAVRFLRGDDDEAMETFPIGKARYI